LTLKTTGLSLEDLWPFCPCLVDTYEQLRTKQLTIFQLDLNARLQLWRVDRSVRRKVVALGASVVPHFNHPAVHGFQLALDARKDYVVLSNVRQAVGVLVILPVKRYL